MAVPPECPAHQSANNPRNQMPLAPEQTPTNDQKTPLDTARAVSSIPRSSNENWVYPSDQMFYNAIRRKNATTPQERDMSIITGIHNAVNERCWQEILTWEAYNNARYSLF